MFEPGDVVTYDNHGGRATPAGVVQFVDRYRVWCCWKRGGKWWSDQKYMLVNECTTHPDADRIRADYTRWVLTEGKDDQ